MRLTVAAVGRLKAGPERSLVDDYIARAQGLGRQIGIGPISVVEIDERKARDPAAQSTRLMDAVQAGAHAIALDERGDQLTSPDFAALMARERDSGCPGLVFLIGGADGHDQYLRHQAHRCIAFGPMVWPHMLVRVMLAEQIYRANAILSGAPYHRA